MHAVSVCVGEEKVSENIYHAGGENEKNEHPVLAERKKVKKSVQLGEMVMVQECDGQVQYNNPFSLSLHYQKLNFLYVI